MGTTYELTGNLRDVIPGGVSSIHAAYIETNVPDGQALVDTTSDGGIAPSNVGRIAMAGNTFALQLLGTNNTGLNVAPGTLRYRVHVEHGKPGLGGLFHWYSAWFELTANANLKTVVGELELVAPSTVADQLDERISALEAGGGGGGGSSAVILSAGGVITLNDALSNGATLFYRFAGPVTVDGIDLPAGFYAFLADPDSESGWSYWTINPPAELPVPDEGGGGDPEDPTETTPQQPTWNDSLLTYVIANTVGVQYKKGGTNIAAGAHDADPGVAVTITAVPKAGYVFPGGVAASWSHTFPTPTSWTTVFSDTLMSPTGEVTSRSGWTITNPNTDPSHIAIDGSGLWATGVTIAEAQMPGSALKHYVEFDYDLSNAGTGSDRCIADIAWSSQPHRHHLRREDSTTVRLETWYHNTLNGDSYYLTGLPLTGKFRAESDGAYVMAYVNGVKVCEAPHDPALTGGNSPVFARVIAKGESLNTGKTRITNVVMATRP